MSKGAKSKVDKNVGLTISQNKSSENCLNESKDDGQPSERRNWQHVDNDFDSSIIVVRDPAEKRRKIEQKTAKDVIETNDSIKESTNSNNNSSSTFYPSEPVAEATISQTANILTELQQIQAKQVLDTNNNNITPQVAEVCASKVLFDYRFSMTFAGHRMLRSWFSAQDAVLFNKFIGKKLSQQRSKKDTRFHIAAEFSWDEIQALQCNEDLISPFQEIFFDSGAHYTSYIAIQGISDVESGDVNDRHFLIKLVTLQGCEVVRQNCRVFQRLDDIDETVVKHTVEMEKRKVKRIPLTEKYLENMVSQPGNTLNVLVSFSALNM